MGRPFEREDRFIVIKRKHLSPAREEALRQYLTDDAIATVECVVVESDWPEYETVWRMIEDRCREAEPCDYDISVDGVMTATPEWQRNDEATMLRLLACHSIDAPLEVVATWTDDQVKAADIWAFSSYLSASDNDDIQVPERPDFIPLAKPLPSDRHPITGEPLS